MHSVDDGIGSAELAGASGRGLPRASVWSRLSAHRVSAGLLAAALLIVGLATDWNLQGWPGRVDDDEGTYVAQAWAILYEHTLTHYSYWYDHPPLGWAQIALFAWVTDGFNRVAAAVFVGREFMWLVTMICCVLLYALCRRIGLRRVTSAASVLLFGLSPLAQFFHRLVSLDNVETMWVLAALVAATSPRRDWRRAALTGVCTAIAVLSKETALILLPVIVWVLLRRNATADGVGGTVGAAGAGGTGGVVEAAGAGGGSADGRSADGWSADGRSSAGWAANGGLSSRTTASGQSADEAADGDGAVPPVWVPDWSAFASRHAGGLRQLRSPVRAVQRLSDWEQRVLAFTVALVVLVAVYPVYALQRGEWPLLWQTLQWQLFKRQGSGSLLDTSSFTYTSVHGWFLIDPWLLGTGLIAAVPLLLSARLRPSAFALLFQLLVLIRGGYLPFFYVTTMLPFAAIAIGGGADVLWTRLDSGWLFGLGGRLGGRGQRYLPYAGRALVGVAALVCLVAVLPGWVSKLNTDSTANGDTPYLAAVSWADKHVAKGSVVVVDDYLWVDLKRDGLSPLWLWKINSQTTPDGWKSIGYIILQPQSAGTLAGMPALQGAYAHSVLVKDFGNGLTARKVVGGG